MANLVAATAAFLATHLVSSTPLRHKLAGAMGEWPYRGLYSLVAFITLAWMIWAYATGPRDALALWTPLRQLPVFVMPFAFVLIACGYRRNPTMVGAERLLKSDDPARGIIRVTRHPIMWGLMLWSAAHVLAKGDPASLVFFGGFLLLAAFGTLAMDARKRSSPGWHRFAAVTSHVPFVALAQGRNRIVWREIGWVRPAIGLALYGAVLLVHP